MLEFNEEKIERNTEPIESKKTLDDQNIVKKHKNKRKKNKNK